MYDHVFLTNDHDKSLSYHAPTIERAAKHERLREAAKTLADVYDELCPHSREGALAFTAVQESLMWANAAVAIHDKK